ncbi:MAG: hypothetical protein IKT00_04135 [Prevotella sp.]|nr:hypothetical protein [Prevotella sp.]
MELATKKAQNTPPDTNLAHETSDTADVANVPQGIDGIRQVWREKTITLQTTESDIQAFAKAFCEQYPGFDPNRALCDHLAGQTQQTEQQGYYVNLEARNGYVSIETTTELPTGTTLCYWKRRNGHKLLAVWMECQKEGQKAEHLLVSYDYDPNTKMMKPEPALSDELDRITKKFPEWSLRLPSEGKDIEIIVFSGPDKDFESTYYNWKWNGHSFRFDPNAHE